MTLDPKKKKKKPSSLYMQVKIIMIMAIKKQLGKMRLTF